MKHVAIVTNRNEPDGGTGLDLIRRHRQKVGTIEHAHGVLMNELAGWCLSSQKFSVNAAWLRMNALLHNLLSAFKRAGLPEEMHDARAKRLRFLVLNNAGKVVHHARETLLRCVDAVVRTFVDTLRVAFRPFRPILPGNEARHEALTCLLHETYDIT